MAGTNPRQRQYLLTPVRNIASRLRQAQMTEYRVTPLNLRTSNYQSVPHPRKIPSHPGIAPRMMILLQILLHPHNSFNHHPPHPDERQRSVKLSSANKSVHLRTIPTGLFPPPTLSPPPFHPPPHHTPPAAIP